MNKMIVLFVNFCLLVSCVSESYIPEAEPLEEGDQTYLFYIEQQNPESLTRSSFSWDDLGVIKNMNIFVYHQGVLLKKYSRYVEDLSVVQMTFPGGKDGFNIYMFGNVGRLEAPLNEIGMADMVHILESYDDFAVKGVPVANVFKGYLKGSQERFAVKRLVGQYNLRMCQSSQDAVYEIKDVRMINCALDMYPFGEDKRACVFTGEDGGSEGDVLTEDDIDALNSGETVELFFIENLQGELLPDNTDPRHKIPSFLPAEVADRCTYIEVTADVTTPMARYTDGKYRFYLGQNQTSDFSIRRNTVYSAVLNFTQNMVMEEDWRIEIDEPKVSEVVFDKEEAMVIAGTYDEIKVNAYDINGCLVNFDERYNVEVVSGDHYLDVTVTSGSLRFVSLAPICGVYPFDREPEYISETVRVTSKETYNGIPLFSKDIKVRIYDKLFPLLFKLERPSPDSPYCIMLRGHNPMNLGLSVGVSYSSSDGVEGTASAYLCSGRRNGLPVDDAVNIQGRVVGYLDADVSEVNLRRINFIIKGIGEDQTGVVQALPRLLKSAELFPGEDTEATYGPYADMYPARCENLPDNGLYIMKYVDGDRNTIVHYGGGTPEEGEVTEIFVWTQVWIYDPNSPDMYFYADADSKGVGKSRFISNSSYNDCPFYVVNAGLTSKYFEVHLNKTLVSYPDRNSSHVDVRLYGSGRDLFFENRRGELIENDHRMYYKVSRWKDTSGMVNIVQDASYYLGWMYMTVNGASSWTGCDESEYGYFTENY